MTRNYIKKQYILRREPIMTTLIEENQKFHSAIPSWSGYNYQGKVAIYSALSFINSKQGVDLSRYSLELEWYEDFAIKVDDTYISIHQVKSYKYTTLSKYKDSIWNLLGKAFEENIQQVFLHTSESILSTDKIEEELITLDPPTKKKNERDYTPFYYYKLITDNSAYNEIFKKIYKYKYRTDNSEVDFCGITEIDNKIKWQIKEYYNLQGKSESEEQINRAFLNILNHLNEHITSRHREEQALGTKTPPVVINMKEFYEILEEDWERASEEYYTQQLRHSFYKTSESFLHTLFKSKRVNEIDLKRAEEFIAQINLLDTSKFLEFCKKVTPYITVRKMDIQKFRELIPVNGLKTSLISTLIMVKQRLDNKHLLQRRINNKTENYLPTTIDHDPTLALVSEEIIVGELASDILENDDLDEFLYEVEAMISHKVKTDSLERAASRIDLVPEVEKDNEQDRNDKFTKIKKIRIVDLNQAKEELNK